MSFEAWENRLFDMHYPEPCPHCEEEGNEECECEPEEYCPDPDGEDIY